MFVTEGQDKPIPTTRSVVISTLREETSIWIFVFKTLLSFFLTGWLAMRFALPQPATAMLTVVVVANRQSGMVLAKSFYRTIGTLVGAAVAVAILAVFPQQRESFLIALALWVGICAGGATLHRNFTSYAFVLSGYTAAIIAFPVIDNPPGVFDSAVARLSEVLLGIMVSGLVSSTLFPVRMRDVLRRMAHAQFVHFIGFVKDCIEGNMTRTDMEKAHLRFVRDAVSFEDLRSSMIFEDADALASSGRLMLFNQSFMAASTSFQSLHHLINRLLRGGHQAAANALVTLYGAIGKALDAPVEPGSASRLLLYRLWVAEQSINDRSPSLRGQLTTDAETSDFDTGASLLDRFIEELRAYIESAVELDETRTIRGSVERIRFTRGNDYAGAGLAFLRTTLVMLGLEAFWIGAEWPAGSSAVTIAAIFSGLFAAAAKPTRATLAVLTGYAFGMSAAFICVFFVLTRMDGYGLFITGATPFLMIGLAMLAWPPTTFQGLGYSMGFAYILATKNTMSFDPVVFINNALSQIVAIGIAAAAYIVVPPAIGSRWLRRRQLGRLRQQVALAAEAPLPGLRHRFESVNHDLFGQIVAQTAPDSRDSRTQLAWALAVHETGRAIIELRNDMTNAPLAADISLAISPALNALARFYEHPDRPGYVKALDAVNDVIAFASRHKTHELLLQHLHLIRLALLDGDSVLAIYMPVKTTNKDNDNHAS